MRSRKGKREYRPWLKSLGLMGRRREGLLAEKRNVIAGDLCVGVAARKVTCYVTASCGSPLSRRGIGGVQGIPRKGGLKCQS